MMADWLICDVECAARVKLSFSKWQLNCYLIESKLSLNHQNKQDNSKYFHTRENNSPVFAQLSFKGMWLFLTKTVTRDRVITKYKRIYFITGVLKTFSDRFISYEKKILESFVLKTCCVIQTRLVKMYIFFLLYFWVNAPSSVSLANKMVTSEIRKKFHALFVKILMILIRVEKTRMEPFSYFTIIPFDYF